METLIDLEIALLDDDADGVSAYLTEIDRRTAAEAFKKAAEDFGFKFIEIAGTVYAQMARASKILGYSDPSGMSKMLDRYQIRTEKIGWFGHDVRSRIRKTFDLDPKDSQASLLPWEGFLVVGMYGQSEAAAKVKVYLLKMEREARILREVSGKEAVEFEMAKIKRLDAVTKAVTAAEKITDPDLKKFIDDELHTLTGRRLPQPRQASLSLIKKEEAEGEER